MRDEIIEPVDREKTCPMLLRLFCKVGEHHRDDEFSYKQQPTDEEVDCLRMLALCLLLLPTSFRAGAGSYLA